MPGIKPKQSLGQNFLTDDNIARNIIEAINPQAGEIIVEIGPGRGALTKFLAEKPARLLAFEVDGRVIDSLKKTYESETIQIFHKDFLQSDLKEISKKYSQKVRIVGNIPYHLTSEILFKVIEERTAIRDVTLMVQREVAQRLIARKSTKAYGILSVLCGFYGELKILFPVSPNCFYPKPDVVSAVISWKLHEHLPDALNEALFKTVVRTTFGKRRKMLRNSLQFLPLESSKVEHIISALKFDCAVRPEQLSIQQFIELTNEIEQLLPE